MITVSASVNSVGFVSFKHASSFFLFFLIWEGLKSSSWQPAPGTNKIKKYIYISICLHHAKALFLSKDCPRPCEEETHVWGAQWVL